jgi:LysM repeat protein
MKIFRDLNLRLMNFSNWLPVMLLALLLNSCATHAQISTVVEEVDGKTCYMHTITKGQTLYSLSKLYGCDINEITSANPGSDIGIQDGQIIKIPVAKAKATNNDVVQEGGKTFLVHEVQKKETLFSIAKLYSIDVNELTAANAGSDQGIKKGQQLRIPVKKSTPAVVATPPVDVNLDAVKTIEQTKHIVAQGETLYSIAKQFGVTVESIENANNGLKEGLKAGQEIFIPAKIVAITTPSVSTNFLDINARIPISEPFMKDSYKIAMMLPFYTHYTDTMETRDKKFRDVAVQFYRGVMMATDSLEHKGVNAELFVYNVLDGKSMVNEVLAKSEMKDIDLLIGPMFKEPLADASIWCAKNGIHVVCPVQQPNKVLMNSINMTKATPGAATQWISVTQFVWDKHKNDNVILINSNNIDDIRQVEVFKSEWFRLNGDSLKHVVKINDLASIRIRDHYVAGKRNIVVVPSSDKKVVTAVFKALGDGEIVVYGTETWDDLDAISIAQRNRYQVHYPQTCFIDYNSPKVVNWIDQYRKKYRTEPGKYAVVGYDMMMYYGMALKQFGKDFPNHLNEVKVSYLVGSGFDYFRAVPEGGFENKFVVMVGTDNYELVRER